MLTIIGKTIDGQLIVDGSYWLNETHGIPLDMVFDLLKNRNCIPSWIHLYQAMVVNGMKHERILAKLQEAMLDVYGAEFTNVVSNILDNHFKEKKS